MSYMIGGYLFIPRPSGVSAAQLAQRAVSVLGQPLLWSAPNAPSRPPAPASATDLAARLEHGSQVVANFPHARMAPLVTFEISPDSYDTVRFVVDSASLSQHEQEGAARGPADAFAAQWAELCQRLEVVYGYFSPLITTANEEYCDDTIIPALAQQDIKTLVAGNWLTYLGPSLAPRLQAPACLRPEEATIQRFPSGALLLRCGVYPFPIP